MGALGIMVEDRDFDSSSESISSGSASSGGLPETPAVRRREKPPSGIDMKSNSNPSLKLPPKISLAPRVGSASAELGRPKSEGKASSSTTSFSDSSPSSPVSSKSIRVFSPSDFHVEDIPVEQPAAVFKHAHEAIDNASLSIAQLSRSAPTPPPHLSIPTAVQHLSLQRPDTEPELSPNYCPHPHTIAMTTRDLPPKGWHVINEHGIVIGSSAAYHGSSVTKVSTRALTLVVSTLNEARDVATTNMLKAASHRGCNAILGMKYDTSSPVPEISLVTAYGTACVIAKDEA